MVRCVYPSFCTSLTPFWVHFGKTPYWSLACFLQVCAVLRCHKPNINHSCTLTFILSGDENHKFLWTTVNFDSKFWFSFSHSLFFWTKHHLVLSNFSWRNHKIIVGGVCCVFSSGSCFTWFKKCVIFLDISYKMCPYICLSFLPKCCRVFMRNEFMRANCIGPTSIKHPLQTYPDFLHWERTT